MAKRKESELGRLIVQKLRKNRKLEGDAHRTGTSAAENPTRRVTRAASRACSGMNEQAESSEDSHTNMKGKGAAITGKRKRPKQEDIRKKGSAKKLMAINATTVDEQKALVNSIEFGGLLLLAYPSVHEKLGLWLVKNFNVNTHELVVPMGTTKVDAAAVHKVFGLPMGPEKIKYEKRSGDPSFLEFYKLVGREEEQKAPTFGEAEYWLLNDGQGLADEKWLNYWLVYAISTLMCPTSATNLCVRSYHTVHYLSAITRHNWCALVVEKLVKGIKDFKGGKKFVTRCLLMILYLDSIDTGNLVDQNSKIRASVWTASAVAKAIEMDKLSDSEFGKLRVSTFSSLKIVESILAALGFLRSKGRGINSCSPSFFFVCKKAGRWDVKII